MNTVPRTTKHRLERKSTTTLIAKSLRERIRNHEFSESGALRQARLAEEYGVSFAPIREALIKLEGEGLLTLVSHHGYVITTLTLDEIQQLYQLRALIETELLRFALESSDPDSLNEAEQLLEQMEKKYRRGKQKREWTDLNWYFHSLLYRPAQKKSVSCYC